MTTTQQAVSDHYQTGDLGSRILAALRAAGKDLSALTLDDLAPVDEFHIRGRAATEELAEWAEIRSGHQVLDVGSGLGGTSRYLAAATGCRVTGLDLTEEYCRVAGMLSEKVGLDGRTAFRQGSALELPFSDARFDIVWTEHVQMNIADKEGFYGEMVRVLKPGGRLAFHDILAGPGGGPRFPVPWAGDPSISHLFSGESLQAVLAALGLVPERWEDTSGASAAFFRGVLKRLRKEGWMPLGLHLLMGDEAEEKFANMLRNLEEDRVRVVQAVMRYAAP